MAEQPREPAIRQLPVEHITVGPRLRALDAAKVEELAESIQIQGLLQPVVVAGAPPRLVAGAHRLAAIQALGWTTVPAVMLPDDDLLAQLAEVDENVVRHDLSALEKGEHLLLRDEVLAALDLRARVGAQPANRNAARLGENEHDTVSCSSTARLEDNAGLAGRIGVSARQVQRLRQIARRLPKDVRDLLRSTGVANATGVLEQLARVDDPGEQLALARILVDGVAANVEEASRLVARQRRAQVRHRAARSATLVGAPREGMARRPDARLLYGKDVRDTLAGLPEASVQTVITSPPYYQMCDYEVPQTLWGGKQDCRHRWSSDICSRCGAWRGQLGWEPSVDAYVEHLVEVLRGVRRVLRPDGTLWLNVGDTYASASTGVVKPKDLQGLPWRVALALVDDGWWLRADIVWAKGASGQRNIREQAYEAAVARGVDDETARAIADDLDPFTGNSAPESAADRPTRTHEYVFLLAREHCYFYDPVGVAEPALGGGDDDAIRQLRSVWLVPRSRYLGEHFAPMPPALARPCIRASTSEAGACASCGAPWVRQTAKRTDFEGWAHAAGRSIEDIASTGKWAGRDRGDSLRSGPVVVVATTGWAPSCSCGTDARVPCVVLDPFAGSGTTGVVALREGRSYIGIDLQTDYLAMAEERLGRVAKRG